MSMDTDFVQWLNNAMGERGWSQSELARRAGIDQSTISRVLAGQGAGSEFCIGIARALGELPERVLRLAGILPPLPPSVQEEHALVQHLRRMSATDRDAVVRMVEGLASASTPPRLGQPSGLSGHTLASQPPTAISNVLMHRPNPENPYQCAFAALAAFLPTSVLADLALRLAEEASEYEASAANADGEREVENATNS